MTYALNCQNAYEINKAMQKQATIIHLKQACDSLHQQAKYNTSRLRELQTWGMGASVGVLALWTAKQLRRAVSFLLSKNTTEMTTRGAVITITTSTRQWRPTLTLLTEVLSFTGVLAVIAISIEHLKLARKDGWWRAVDYYFVEISTVGSTSAATTHRFLIRKDVLRKQPFHFKERRLLEIPLYGMSAVFVASLWGYVH
jgi:hypothetical protein